MRSIWRRVLLLWVAGVVGCAAGPQELRSNEAPLDGPSLDGPWHGAIEANGRQIQLDAVYAQKAGALKGALDVRAQGLRGLPMEFLEHTGRKLVFKVELVTGQAVLFDGAVEQDRISGTFQQGPAKLPFWFQRGERKVVAMAARGDGYEEKEISFENGKVHLAGTLTLPAGVERPPVAILCTGSGAQDRNEEVFGFKVFEALAHQLAKGGVATLRFDDRGVGQSTGNFLTATTHDFSTDVEAAIAFLETRPEVDSQRLGIIGHSEGGLVAPMVASRNERVRFVVLLAGPGQPLSELLLEQIQRVGLAEGEPREKVQREVEVTRKLIANLLQGRDLSSLEAELGTLCEGDCPSRAEFVKAERWKMENAWFRYLIAYDPRPTLKRVRCPVLALGGALDLQVPSDLNLPLIQKALAEGKNGRVSIQSVPGMNHVLQAAKTGAVSEYTKLPKELEPSLVPRILSWLQAAAGTKTAAAR